MIEQLEKQKTSLGQQIAATKRALEDAEQQHVERQEKAEQLSADARTGKSVNPEALAEAHRAVGESERNLTNLRPHTERALRDLTREMDQVQVKLDKATRELNRAKFSDAAVKYESLLKEAIPLSREIRQLAHAAGIALEQHNSCLLDHLDITELTLGGRALFQHRPW